MELRASGEGKRTRRNERNGNGLSSLRHELGPIERKGDGISEFFDATRTHETILSGF